MKCKNCNKEISKLRGYLWSTLCVDCSKEKFNIRKKVEEIDKIMNHLGYFQMNEDNYDVCYRPDLVYWADVEKDGEEIAKVSFKELIKQFKEKIIDEEEVKKMFQLRKEIHKIKTREKRYKIIESAEKEIYGKAKTKRITIPKDQQEQILARFNNECAICSAKEGLHIHHKDQNPKNNQMGNLIVLCGVCHKKVHMKVR